MPSISIFTEKITPRLQFVAEFLFETVLKNEVLIFENFEEFEKFQGAKINYSNRKIQGVLQILPSEILFQTTIERHKIEFGKWDELPTIFPNSGELPFDIFAATFFLVSRYEEYLATDFDAHGRFKADESVAKKGGFLQRPIVDLWAKKLAEKIGISSGAKFRFVPTFDVDNFYKYRRKGLLRTAAHFLRDVLRRDFTTFRERFLVVFEKKEDPFFNFSELEKLHENSPKPIWFFHVGGFFLHDKSTIFSRFCARYNREMARISKTYEIGLHPSYRASFAKKRIKNELASLPETTVLNRFHYLRFRLPESYETLIALGFEHDFSMIFPGEIGFRAGTSFPFYFFNLKTNKITNLKIHPTAIMDTTLRRKNFNPLAHKELVGKMLAEVKEVGGEFCTLFHNQNLTSESENAPWIEFYKAIIREAKC